MLSSLGKMLMVLGVFSLLLGGLLVLGSKIPGLGRLPGDIYVQKGNFSFYFPLVTSLIVSIVFSLILNFLFRR